MKNIKLSKKAMLMLNIILSLLIAHFVLVILFIGNFSLENLRKLFAKIRYEKY
jgi:hypothetical protein